MISLIGKGESRASSKDDWEPSYVTQLLLAGAFVRTRELSQMALLLRDQTQLRLNENSMVQIKKIINVDGPTQLELPKGRVWMQLKRNQAAYDPPPATPALIIETPNATAAIRGTDWALDVDDEGNTLLSVQSGLVDFYNDFGHVQVAANEQARAVPGKAPYRVLLTQIERHVQWVTSYRPQPRRWASQDHSLDAAIDLIETGRLADARAVLETEPESAVRARLLADMALFVGETQTALSQLAPYPDDPLCIALTIRSLLVAGDLQAAEQLTQTALTRFPDEIEIHLAAGDLARISGSEQKATNAFEHARRLDAKNSEAWFGLGRVASAKEDVRHGRRNLNQAIALNPDGPGYRGELGTLETFANRFPLAEAQFEEALRIAPDDYLALTGRGILLLKEGKPEEALQSLLKATLIEPRFARAVLYTGVAYYQLGRHLQARETIQRAAELDPNDPLPHFMLTMIAEDTFDYGTAIGNAQTALDLMPYLYSLDQILTNQKGNANLGYALAQFGLEEWAQSYAYESYTPYWAGSGLFLADRYSGSFTRNSELFRGFITDPSTFGASNRFNSLIPAPGDYFAIKGTLGRGDVKTTTASATVNGYHTSPFPTSYFIDFERPWIRPDREDLNLNNRNWTIGLGAKPTYELSLFAFASVSNLDADVNLFNLSGDDRDRTNIDTRRFDLGAHYRISPTNMLWVKAAYGKENGDVHGSYTSPLLAEAIRQRFGLRINPRGEIQSLDNDFEQREFELRQTFDVNPDYQITWGIEQATAKEPVSYQVDFQPIQIKGERISRSDSLDAYLSNRYKPTPQLLTQFDLGYQHFRQKNDLSEWVQINRYLPDLSTADYHNTDKTDSWMPRLGLAWEVNDGQTLRLAYQDWRRPASASTLSAVDTVGILVDDRVTQIGGELKQWHIRYDWEIDRSSFLQGFFQHQKIDNPYETANLIPLTYTTVDLNLLRNRQALIDQRVSFWEATPNMVAAKIDRFGIAYNRLITPNITGIARYWYSDGHSTDSVFSGKAVPWMPRHWIQIGSNWLPLPRLQLSANATYRSHRFSDPDNYIHLNSGWVFGLRGYWENADKRWSIEALIDNINGDRKNSVSQGTLYGLQAVYRF